MVNSVILQNLPTYNRTLLRIFSNLSFELNKIEELNKNASNIKNILDEHSKLYDVTHIEFYNKERASVYIKVYKLNGCFYYYYSTFSFDAIMKWYSGVTPIFKEFQLIN